MKTRTNLDHLTPKQRAERKKDDVRRNMEARRRAFARLAAYNPTLFAALLQEERARVDRERGPMLG